jgi:hypothetical protein
MTIEAPPRSRLAATRDRLADALDGSGIRTALGGRFSAPCVLIEPAEPWIDRDTPSSRLQVRWKLTAIAGRTDTAAAYDALADLIDAVDVALLSLRGVSLPTWGAPHDLTLGNVAHPASVAVVLMYSEV